MSLLKNFSQRVKDWSVRNENRNAFILVFACTVGCIAGFGSFLLKSLIHMIASWLAKGLDHWPLEWLHADWWLLVLPLAGILIAMLWQKKVAHSDMVHCTSHIVDYLNSKNYAIPGRLIYNPVIACGFTLGFGGSAGAEGPVAYAGAAVGSRLGRALGLDDDMLRVMIGIGAGAGIAGLFKSPIAGLLFTLEVLKMNMGAAPVIGLLMACVCSSLTCYAFTGNNLYLPFTQTPAEGVPVHWVFALGMFCGVYSLIYNLITVKMRGFFNTRRRQWVTWLSGGLTAGAILLMFPSIYGEGYPIMTQLINGDHSGVLGSGLLETSPSDTTRFMWILAALLVLKALATVCSNSAGGVAGDFAPTLFAGAVAGTLFSLVVKAVFGVEISAPLCALFAMAGCFSGIVHAPVMSIFLVTEMTGTSEYILPIAVCAAASFITVKVIYPASRYVETHYDDFTDIFRSSHK